MNWVEGWLGIVVMSMVPTGGMGAMGGFVVVVAERKEKQPV